MLANGYLFLDLDDPVCAWGAYRGVLVPPRSSPETSSVSLWFASLVRRGRREWLDLEVRLERVREERHNGKTSRLQGLYFFSELDSSRRFSGESGLKHCSFGNLAEIHVVSPRKEKFDLNWITNWRNHRLADEDWMDRYWRHEPYPYAEPIWECLTEHRVTVLGTDLRNIAYAKIKRDHPDSLALLEIARIAAWLNSDLGSISPHVVRIQDELEIRICMDFRDATNPAFLKSVGSYMASENPVNRKDISAQFSNQTFGRVPDMTFMNATMSGIDL
jgi:hypothetical protein